jgi:hypothetical protein
MVQDLVGDISLAFAVQKTGSSDITVFLASMVSHELSQINFASLLSSSLPAAGVDPTFKAKSMRIGSASGLKRQLLTVEGSLNSRLLLYLLGSGDAALTLLEVPEHISPGSQNLLAHCSGMNYGSDTNYFLYKIGDEQRLLGQSGSGTDSSGKAHGPLSYDYSLVIAGTTCKCVALLHTPTISQTYTWAAQLV